MTDGPAPEIQLATRAIKRNWKFQIEANFGVLECSEPVPAPELVMDSATMFTLTTDTLKVQAHPSCPILATASCDAALHSVRSIADRCGFETWRRLLLRYEPTLGIKSLASLDKVMESDLRGQQFMDKFQIWENQTGKQSAVTSEVHTAF